MNYLSNKPGRKVDSSRYKHGEENNIKVDVNRTGRFIWLKLICRDSSWRKNRFVYGTRTVYQLTAQWLTAQGH